MAKIYWRVIKRGSRTFNSIPDHLKEEVKDLALQEVADGIIDYETYSKLIEA